MLLINTSMAPDNDFAKEGVRVIRLPCNEVASELGNAKLASMVALGAAVLKWALTAGLNFVALNPLPGAFQYALSVALFPFLGWVCARTQHAVLQQD